MPFSVESFDPETLALLTQAFDAAWQEVQASNAGRSGGELITIRKLMAHTIMAAANNGERDIERLKVLAISAVDGRKLA